MPAGRPRGSGGTGLPTALKVLKGGHPERINRDEPIPDEGLPECPTDNPDVREVWDYTIKQLEQMKTVSLADRDMLHAYCEQVVQYRRAAQMIHEDGAIIEGPRGPQKHPATIILRDSASMMRGFASCFGLTPQGRSAIRVGDQRATPAPQAQAPAARLLSS